LTTTQAAKRPRQEDILEELDALFRLDDEAAGELLLVRHGRAANTPLPWATGESSPDPLLSCEGLSQAERLAGRLSSLWIEAVYAAPERRCFQTAKVIADVVQRPLEVVEGLADIGFDPAQAYEGGSYAGRFSLDPRWEALPGFAPGRAFRRGAVAAIEAVIAAHPARRSVVITHASVINAYLSMLLCIPRDQFFAPDHASISTVRHRDDRYGLRSLNDTSHLDVSDQLTSLPPAFTPRSLPLTNR
jgi:broad specificity phosphatase PhoE